MIMNKPSMEDDEKGVQRTGYIHIAVSVGSIEKVDELTAMLKEDGYYESCVICIEDNQIEITA